MTDSEDVLDASVAARRAALLARVRTGDYLDAQDFPAMRWVVPGLIPEGFGLFTGRPKVGKSWAALSIGLSLASARPAFGSIPIGLSRPVLLLALEDGERRLKGRCRHLLGDVPIPPLLHYITTAQPGEILDLIDAWLSLHGRAAPLVVLDTLGRVMPNSNPGESAYQRDYRIGGALKRRADAHPGTCLLVVHHERKTSAREGDWMDSTSGTNGLNGAADWTLNLHRGRNEVRGMLRVTGRDVPEGEYAVTTDNGVWTLDGHSLEAAAKVAEEVKATEGLGDRSAEIVAYLAMQPVPVKAATLERALNLPDGRRYLARLADAGRIRRTARGLYAPVPSVPMSQVPPEESPPTNPLSQVGDVATQRGNGTLGTAGHRDDDQAETWPVVCDECHLVFHSVHCSKRASA